MAASQTAFILVPGSFCPGLAYDKLRAQLAAANYASETVELATIDNSRSPAASMYDDAADIRTAILKQMDAGKNVVVVMNSYGGLPGTEATRGLSRSERNAAGASTAVTGLVYLAAHMQPAGVSIRNDWKHRLGEIPETLEHLPDREYLPLTPGMGPLILSDVPAKEAEELYATFQCHSSRSFSDEATWEGWKHIPPTFVYCLGDTVIVPEQQKGMIDKANEALAAEGKKSVTVVECDAGHGPHVSRPELVKDVLIQAANEKSMENNGKM